MFCILINDKETDSPLGLYVALGNKGQLMVTDDLDCALKFPTCMEAESLMALAEKQGCAGSPMCDLSYEVAVIPEGGVEAIKKNSAFKKAPWNTIPSSFTLSVREQEYLTELIMRDAESGLNDAELALGILKTFALSQQGLQTSETAREHIEILTSHIQND